MLRRLLAITLVSAVTAGILQLFISNDISLPIMSFFPAESPPEKAVLAGGLPVDGNLLKSSESNLEVPGGSIMNGANNAIEHGSMGSSLTEGQDDTIDPTLYSSGGADNSVSSSSQAATTDEVNGFVEQDAPPDLPIAGRVKSESGDGIQGIGVGATALRLFSASGEASSPRTGMKYRARTDSDGWYEFRSLRAGEYEIRTEPTNRFPAARITARTGSEAAHILLGEARELRVTGTVRNPSGVPLADALVQPIDQGDGVVTDSTGTYALTLSVVQQGAAYMLDVSLPGYQDRRLGIRESEMRGVDEIQVDAVLEPITDTAVFSGTVKDADEQPLGDAAVRLHSPGSTMSYQTQTDANGGFIFPQVVVGNDYQLWVRAGEFYKDHVEQPLQITVHGLKVPIILESVGIASLSGRMVDARGTPLPWLGMWLRSVESAAAIGMINSDGDGYFHIENLRAGELRLQTHVPPYLVVSGITLDAGMNETVELTLDVGNLEIRGQVTDEQGMQVAGAEVSVSWSFQNGPLSSRSSRRTSSLGDGSFVFTGLGPGVHALSISVAGFQSTWVEHDPLTDGEDILVALAAETI